MQWTRIFAFATCLVLVAATFGLAQIEAEASMDQAKRLYRNGNYRGALEELSRVLDQEPGRADALYLRGYSYFMLREYQDSVEAFNAAFAADPGFDPRTIYQARAASESEDPTP